MCIKKWGGGTAVLVFAVPFHYKKTFKPLYEHRPVLCRDIDTKKVCENFGYDYLSADTYDVLPVEKGTPLLVCGAGIIPEKIIDKYIVINAHPGYIPLVRGLDALKWAVIENKPVGVTSHIIGPEVDAGSIIQRRIVPVYKNDTFHAVAQRVYEYEITMLVDALKLYTDKHEYIGAGNNILHKRMPPSIEKGLLDAFCQYAKEKGIERIRCNMNRFYRNWDFDIVGVSTIDNPVDNTILFMPESEQYKAEKLENFRFCVVVTAQGFCPGKKLSTYNFFIMDENPEEKFNALLAAMR